jgi:hypothetical protein
MANLMHQALIRTFVAHRGTGQALAPTARRNRLGGTGSFLVGVGKLGAVQRAKGVAQYLRNGFSICMGTGNAEQ